MTGQYLKKLKLPDGPGVYTFRDAKRRPLYIGRATSLKDRVRSYSSIDLIETRGPRIIDMVTKSKTLTWQETDSVLEAVLLESRLIKRYQPFYNVDERDDKSDQYVVITQEPWPRVFLVRARDFEQTSASAYKIKKHFGPYPSSGLIKEALRILRKMFPFKDKKSLDPRHDAFYRAIGRSPRDPTPLKGTDNARRRYLRTIDNLALFFEGKKSQLRDRLQREMDAHARRMRFEEALDVKKLLYAIHHIRDMAMIKRADDLRTKSSRNFRMEAYDVAHISGTNVVGVMTVSIDGELAPAEYRKFKISREENNDIAGLVEIISRRLNHSEWDYPELIVVDGNEMQKRAAEGVLMARRVPIPVLAVTKDERHKASEIIGDPELVEKYRKEIIALNAEAHRFAIAYHRGLRYAGVRRN